GPEDRPCRARYCVGLRGAGADGRRQAGAEKAKVGTPHGRSSREDSKMRRRSRLTLFCSVSLYLIILWSASCTAQVARTELHAVPTLTLSDRQFLIGDKNGTTVTIAGVLRIPRLGTDRLPAVILVHGSGGIGGNVDRWSQELNGIGLATFVTDSFTARGIQSTSANQSLLGRLNMI